MTDWILILVLLCLIYFYRYPKKILRGMDEKFVFSPAYGTVYKIDHNKSTDEITIAIFLSPLDIHYQFVPISGVVEHIEYDYNGKFELAFNINKSRHNEKVITSIRNSRGLFKVYQIAGFLVRRVANDLHLGQIVESGQDLGLIHFGSRVDITIPNGSNFSVFVHENQYVNGSESILGYYA